ncbi:MAG: hypothetical protein LBN40_04010 [Oscillospiraceae bacterium]|jgi:hypothetical protein|nr:hypothetical protein [Oscillospiraceae bacterium]
MLDCKKKKVRVTSVPTSTDNEKFTFVYGSFHLVLLKARSTKAENSFAKICQATQVGDSGTAKSDGQNTESGEVENNNN